MSKQCHPLRTYRLAQSVTLQQLGDMFGVNKTTVMRWEEGKVPAERVVQVERMTGIPRKDLRPDLYSEPAA